MTKRNQDFSKDILSLIRSSVSPAVLSERLQDFHENDLAEVLRELMHCGAQQTIPYPGKQYAGRCF